MASIAAKQPKITIPIGDEVSAARERDEFAMACMQGLLAHPTSNRWEETHAARLAYKYADAMLAERAKPRPQANV